MYRILKLTGPELENYLDSVFIYLFLMLLNMQMCFVNIECEQVRDECPCSTPVCYALQHFVT